MAQLHNASYPAKTASQVEVALSSGSFSSAASSVKLQGRMIPVAVQELKPSTTLCKHPHTLRRLDNVAGVYRIWTLGCWSWCKRLYVVVVNCPTWTERRNSQKSNGRMWWRIKISVAGYRQYYFISQAFGFLIKSDWRRLHIELNTPWFQRLPGFNISTIDGWQNVDRPSAWRYQYTPVCSCWRVLLRRWRS